MQGMWRRLIENRRQSSSSPRTVSAPWQLESAGRSAVRERRQRPRFGMCHRRHVMSITLALSALALSISILFCSALFSLLILVLSFTMVSVPFSLY